MFPKSINNNDGLIQQKVKDTVALNKFRGAGQSNRVVRSSV